ncbi:hypothetical protein [Runella sp. CRIBMP]|uniref:hypothetical protein n=1 Tax=Runella sp. CRIBMP TaxID=2683261 RepID=UPI001E2C2C4D|nr:hypothetical protein [Runella sp. CRIBMP]
MFNCSLANKKNGHLFGYYFYKSFTLHYKVLLVIQHYFFLKYTTKKPFTMTKRNHLTTPPIHPASLVKPTLIGAGIALTVITIFLVGVREPNPAWGKLWMLRPLIIVPLAGAMGGAFVFFMDY